MAGTRGPDARRGGGGGLETPGQRELAPPPWGALCLGKVPQWQRRLPPQTPVLE